MSSDRVKIEDMAKAVMDRLEDYKNLASDELNKAVKSAAKTVKSEIEEHAPKRYGKYKESWAITKLSESSSGISLVVHSKTRPFGEGTCQTRRRTSRRKAAYCAC